ncbi:hydroxymethylbilane synthase [Riemerella columbipharyngis]|uniref:Hydroxymethylbilane synthase n=1 Tax=Riemerella columbipharyngis TaxID=1071918 RepID=A0A1G7B4T1_9FLAO|nr:hydroxymethylbilane synthase [Riemerella columbipharyngis]SDE21890.1 hydroxymethylbilane synthase [Riemerella columbipharyngis]
MKSIIRIGTRKSPLALWQAESVASQLEHLGHSTEIVPIVSSGDKNLKKPLYDLGITGVFTKDLDIALLNNQIDIAVHSLKDVPTQLPQNIELIAFLERDFPQDVLVRRKEAKHLSMEELKLATSSLRRRAFWMKNFGKQEFADIRGNVQTRLKKLDGGIADATLFSLAGLKRMEMDIEFEHLPFMLSAPAQGVIAVAGNSSNIELNTLISNINHRPTEICVTIERQFLQTLEGGCTAPIGAFASFLDDGKIHFQGWLCSLDGTKCLDKTEVFHYTEDINYGENFAKNLLEQGGKELMQEIKNTLN